MVFYQELDVFGAVPVRKKDEILDFGRDSLYFQVLSWHFHFMHVPPLPGGHQIGVSFEEAHLVNTILNQTHRHRVQSAG